MFAYCVGELRMSEDAAYKRIQAARAARGFPAMFGMVEAGRLSLTVVVRLAPHLRADTASELLDAAVHKTKPEIEVLLAERFPQPDVATFVRAIPTAAGAASSGARFAERAAAPEPAAADRPSADRLVPEPVDSDAPPASVAACPPPAAPPARVTPLAPQRFALQVTLSQEAHDLLRQAQALLGHSVPSGDLAQVLTRALRELVTQLERCRFAETPRPRPRRSHANTRCVPAEVRREVWTRDGGRCTFVGTSGHRCESRRSLEYDHVRPLARGGVSSTENLRLRCRAHNQHEADMAFGPGFMQGKRDASRRRQSANPSVSVTASQDDDARRSNKPAVRSATWTGHGCGRSENRTPSPIP